MLVFHKLASRILPRKHARSHSTRRNPTGDDECSAATTPSHGATLRSSRRASKPDPSASITVTGPASTAFPRGMLRPRARLMTSAPPPAASGLRAALACPLHPLASASMPVARNSSAMAPAISRVLPWRLATATSTFIHTTPWPGIPTLSAPACCTSLAEVNITFPDLAGRWPPADVEHKPARATNGQVIGGKRRGVTYSNPRHAET